MFQKTNREKEINEKKIVDQIRSLGLDMIQESGSGHPGIVLGAAPIIYTLYAHHLRINPKNPDWVNRDRFILSAGHGSALLYATLFMAGYALSMEDLKKFRKLNSITPGHPEYRVTPGVDASTGPLGQGFGTAVGIAVAERYFHHYYQNNLIDYYTYVLCSDGDLMEGISYEAASFAGIQHLNRLIVLYDSNQVSLDGPTSLTFDENIKDRFESLGWNYILVSDGEEIASIDRAIEKAKTSTNKPSIIEVKTTIGKYSKNQGTSLVHGSPLSEEDYLAVKEKLNVRDIPFLISKDTLDDFQELIGIRMEEYYKPWMESFETQDTRFKKEMNKMKKNDLSISIGEIICEKSDEATRVISGKVLNEVADQTPLLVGGSADLFESTKTYLEVLGNMASSNPLGRNIYYGVREGAMGAISNGMALSGLRPYASTFLTFSDYLKPAIRMSAMMKLPVIYIFTHDSISVGADGPSHQPVEQLVSLRSIPNLEVYRPADQNEVMGVWKTILSKKENPSAIILGREKVKTLEHTNSDLVEKGGYIVRKEEEKCGGILLATGREVILAVEVAKKLFNQGIDLRVVSMPSIERFRSMPTSYQEEILPKNKTVIAIEQASPLSWYSFVTSKEHIISIDAFGASGSCMEVEEKFQFDFKTVMKKIKKLF